MGACGRASFQYVCTELCTAHRYARDASLISTLYAHWGFTATDAECAHVFVADVSTAATRSPAIPVHVKAFYEPSAARKA